MGVGATGTNMRLRVQPAIAGRVIELLLHNDGGLTELVEADPSLCAVVVRAANSAHLGLSRRVGGVRQAMVLLGQDATTALAVARTADLVFDDDVAGAPNPPSWVWPHAVGAATASAWLARRMDVNPEHAYTAALLQNLPVLMGERHDNDHGDRAAQTLERWNFPDAIVSAVRHHHRPIDEVIAPLDRVIVCGRTLAAEAGLPDGRALSPLQHVTRAADLGRNEIAAAVKDVHRALDALVRLAGPR
jgi:HD-like signal output (HDOD) protein